MLFVYVLQSHKDKKFYIGQTKNLADRLERHNAGRVSATKWRVLLSLKYSEQFQTRSGAIQREGFLRSLKGNDIFKKVIGMKT